MNFCPECGAKVNGKFCTNCGTSLQVAETQAPTAKADTAAPMHPEPKNDGLISLLYALRAGISHLSLKYDEFEKAESLRDEKSSYLQAYREAHADVSEKLSTTNRQYERVKSREPVLENALSKLNGEDMKAAKKKDKSTLFVHRLFFILALITFVIYFPACFSVLNWDDDMMLYGLLIMFGIPAIFIVFVVIWARTDKYREAQEAVEGEIKKVKAELKEIRNLKADAKKYAIELEAIDKKIEKSSGFDNSKELAKLSGEGKALYQSLESTFGSLLHPGDWAHLDSIIFCLETKRANTLQEALHQADLFIRHEEMKSVIVAVGKQISQTIASSAMHISWQLEAVAENQIKIVEGLRNINTNLLSTKEMQKSLLEKANENSEQLMEDVKSLCSYADTAAKEGPLWGFDDFDI